MAERKRKKGLKKIFSGEEETKPVTETAEATLTVEEKVEQPVESEPVVEEPAPENVEASDENEPAVEAPKETVEEPAAEPVIEEEIVEDIVSEEPVAEVEETPAKTEQEPPCVSSGQTEELLRSIESEIAELKAVSASIKADMDKYATTKEQQKEFRSVIDRRDSEMANRKLVGMLEQLSSMREDFFKLCKGMESKIDSFSAKDVLSSFQAYGVDMENMLLDSGVYIGPFKQYDKLNTIHQRIVDVIPTDDASKNGMIAERISDGYEYNGRVLFKERVNIFKFSGEDGKTE